MWQNLTQAHFWPKHSAVSVLTHCKLSDYIRPNIVVLHWNTSADHRAKKKMVHFTLLYQCGFQMRKFPNSTDLQGSNGATCNINNTKLMALYFGVLPGSIFHATDRGQIAESLSITIILHVKYVINMHRFEGISVLGALEVPVCKERHNSCTPSESKTCKH